MSVSTNSWRNMENLSTTGDPPRNDEPSHDPGSEVELESFAFEFESTEFDGRDDETLLSLLFDEPEKKTKETLKTCPSDRSHTQMSTASATATATETLQATILSSGSRKDHIQMGRFLGNDLNSVGDQTRRTSPNSTMMVSSEEKTNLPLTPIPLSFSTRDPLAESAVAAAARYWIYRPLIPPRVGDLPKNYVPLGSKNRKHLKTNINLRHLQRLVKERQSVGGTKGAHPSELANLKKELHSRLKVVHNDGQLDELVFVIEVDDDSQGRPDSLGNHGDRHYRRAKETKDRNEFAEYITGKHNYPEFLTPWDRVLMDRVRSLSALLISRCPSQYQKVAEFTDMVDKLRDLLVRCSFFQEILEEDCVKFVNEAWKKLSADLLTSRGEKLLWPSNGAPGGGDNDGGGPGDTKFPPPNQGDGRRRGGSAGAGKRKQPPSPSGRGKGKQKGAKKCAQDMDGMEVLSKVITTKSVLRQSSEVPLESKKPFSAYAENNVSVGPSVASSTYGEELQNVSRKIVRDAYGDSGEYTGVVLRSTGMPHVTGKMIYQEDNRIYDGEWRHGRWHGYGESTFANGDNYVGEYRFDQRHGSGRYEWHDGRVYDGMFRDHKRHGKGRFEWPDGAVYDGEFRNGQREGLGVYTSPDGGRRYVGQWLNGMCHGRGVETFADGSIRHDGEWREDEPVLDDQDDTRRRIQSKSTSAPTTSADSADSGEGCLSTEAPPVENRQDPESLGCLVTVPYLDVIAGHGDDTRDGPRKLRGRQDPPIEPEILPESSTWTGKSGRQDPPAEPENDQEAPLVENGRDPEAIGCLATAPDRKSTLLVTAPDATAVHGDDTRDGPRKLGGRQDPPIQPDSFPESSTRTGKHGRQHPPIEPENDPESPAWTIKNGQQDPPIESENEPESSAWTEKNPPVKAPVVNSAISRPLECLYGPSMWQRDQLLRHRRQAAFITSKPDPPEVRTFHEATDESLGRTSCPSLSLERRQSSLQGNVSCVDPPGTIATGQDPVSSEPFNSLTGEPLALDPSSTTSTLDSVGQKLCPPDPDESPLIIRSQTEDKQGEQHLRTRDSSSKKMLLSPPAEAASGAEEKANHKSGGTLVKRESGPNTDQVVLSMPGESHNLETAVVGSMEQEFGEAECSQVASRHADMRGPRLSENSEVVTAHAVLVTETTAFESSSGSASGQTHLVEVAPRHVSGFGTAGNQRPPALSMMSQVCASRLSPEREASSTSDAPSEVRVCECQDPVVLQSSGSFAVDRPVDVESPDNSIVPVQLLSQQTDDSPEWTVPTFEARTHERRDPDRCTQHQSPGSHETGAFAIRGIDGDSQSLSNDIHDDITLMEPQESTTQPTITSGGGQTSDYIVVGQAVQVEAEYNSTVQALSQQIAELREWRASQEEQHQEVQQHRKRGRRRRERGRWWNRLRIISQNG